MKNLLDEMKINSKYLKASCVIVLIFIMLTLLLPNKETNKMLPAPESTSSNVVAKNDQLAEKIGIIELIELELSEYEDAEVTVWHNNDLAIEDNPPYEVIVNFPFDNIYTCPQAEKISYYLIDSLYKNARIRKDLSRVLVSIPYCLRVSLGASDGTLMAENNLFIGPTNFWDVMDRTRSYENETGDLENRTWGNKLMGCQ